MSGKGRSRTGVWVCALAAALALSMSMPASAGFFDFLFGGPRQSRPPEQPPAAMDRPAPGMDVPRGERYGAEPRISGGSGIATSYCVRLCDGRYFPIQRSSTTQAAQVCSSLCPAAATKVFFGSDIARATARDGKQYDDLDNAFAYRQKTVDNCTCNGHSPYGLATLTPAQDPTLRPGDLVATTEGLVKSAGAQAYGKASDEDVTSALRPSIDDGEAKQRVRRSYNRRDNFSRHNTWQ
jgi:hypothetical protein